MVFNRTFTKYCRNYVVSSKKLFDIYSNMDGIKKPFGIVGDSFEKEKFFLANIERFNINKNSKLVIGWVGNSTWNEKQKDAKGRNIDFKGFYTVLKLVIEELQKEGYNIELNCAYKARKQILNEDMWKNFSNIHIYVCVSYKEVTPKPLLESMGCGVPIITTDVGIANEVLGLKQKKYIISQRIIGENEEYIKQQLKNNIIKLYNNRKQLKELSKENYEKSKKY